jgi:hypothetical protein
LGFHGAQVGISICLGQGQKDRLQRRSRPPADECEGPAGRPVGSRVPMDRGGCPPRLLVERNHRLCDVYADFDTDAAYKI